MTTYDMASDGIQIHGASSYHVAHTLGDTWHLLRMVNGDKFLAAEFSSPDEARAFAQAMGLVIDRV